MRLVHGVGFTDYPTCDGEGKHIKPYTLWKDMLYRCYSEKYQEKYPSYIDCKVCDEWHLFSNFKRFFDDNYIDGYELDKDLISPNMRLYSPDACIFVPHTLNSFLRFNGGRWRDLPAGVTFKKSCRRYLARVNGEYVGGFEDAISANHAYIDAKIQAAKSYQAMCESIRPGLYENLISAIQSMRVNE